MLKSLKSNYSTSKQIIDCLTKVNNISINNHVTLDWVPGHQGIYGNEMTDELINSSLLPFAPGLTCSTQKSLIYELFIGTHRWLHPENCKHSGEFIIGSNRSTTLPILNKSRDELSMHVFVPI